jgi:hypothetical protein
MAQTPRSSSLVENLNSRLRSYFTLRRHLGGSYLVLYLLRFFLNYRRFIRSQRAERSGKSPRELMTGQNHPHWLTLLGHGLIQPRPLDPGSLAASRQNHLRPKIRPSRAGGFSATCVTRTADSEPRRGSGQGAERSCRNRSEVGRWTRLREVTAA